MHFDSALKSSLNTRRFVLALVIIAFTATVGTPGANAQDDASIAGLVMDASGSGVAGANVLITNAETRSQRQVATDEAGRFYSPSLPVGSYEVSVDKSGF